MLPVDKPDRITRFSTRRQPRSASLHRTRRELPVPPPPPHPQQTRSQLQPLFTGLRSPVPRRTLAERERGLGKQGPEHINPTAIDSDLSVARPHRASSLSISSLAYPPGKTRLVLRQRWASAWINWGQFSRQLEPLT